jgi:hypothetical protein
MQAHVLGDPRLMDPRTHNKPGWRLGIGPWRVHLDERLPLWCAGVVDPGTRSPTGLEISGWTHCYAGPGRALFDQEFLQTASGWMPDSWGCQCCGPWGTLSPVGLGVAVYGPLVYVFGVWMVRLSG